MNPLSTKNFPLMKSAEGSASLYSPVSHGSAVFNTTRVMNQQFQKYFPRTDGIKFCDEDEDDIIMSKEPRDDFDSYYAKEMLPVKKEERFDHLDYKRKLNDEWGQAIDKRIKMERHHPCLPTLLSAP